jgi:hypothetical protein
MTNRDRGQNSSGKNAKPGAVPSNNSDATLRVKLIILIAVTLIAIGVAIIFYFTLFEGRSEKSGSLNDTESTKPSAVNSLPSATPSAMPSTASSKIPSTTASATPSSTVPTNTTSTTPSTLRSLTEAHNESKDMDAFFDKPIEEPKTASFTDEDKIFAEVHPFAYKKYHEGNALASKGNYPVAHQCYIDSLHSIVDDQAKSRKHEFDRAWLSRDYGLIAVCLCEQHMYQPALAHLEEAQILDSDLEDNCILEANIYLITKQKEKELAWRKKFHDGRKN